MYVASLVSRFVLNAMSFTSAMSAACKKFTVNERGVSTLLVDDSSQDMTPWFIYSTRPDGLSVNAQLNVVVTRPYSGDIRVYTPGGRLLRNVALHSDVSQPH